MTSRKLWTWSIEDGSLVNDPNGDLVLLTDANAAVEAAEERMYEAAYEAGKAYGMTVNGYTRGRADAARDVAAAYKKAWDDTQDSPPSETAVDAARGVTEPMKPIPDKDGNTAGWWDDMYRFHRGTAVTHTRESTPSGPDYCQECSDAESDWVRWPCPHTVNEEESYD